MWRRGSCAMVLHRVIKEHAVRHPQRGNGEETGGGHFEARLGQGGEGEVADPLFRRCSDGGEFGWCGGLLLGGENMKKVNASENVHVNLPGRGLSGPDNIPYEY